MRKNFGINHSHIVTRSNVRLIFHACPPGGAFAVVVVVAFFEPKPRQRKTAICARAGLSVAKSGNRRARTLVSKRDGSRRYRLPGDSRNWGCAACNSLGLYPAKNGLPFVYDGLDREIKFFDRLDGDVCTTCALRGQENL